MNDTVFPRWQGALLGLCLLAEGLYLPASGAALRGVLAADALVLLLALGWLWLLSARRVPDFYALCDALPRLAGVLLRLAAALIAAVGVWRSLSRLSAFWQATAFPGVPRWLLGAVLLAVAALAARRGRIAVCMWAYPTAWLAALTVTASLLITLPDCDWGAARAVFGGSSFDQTAFCGPLWTLALLPLCETRRTLPAAGAAAHGLVFGGIGLALLCLRALLVLGAGAAAIPYPVFAAAGVFSVGDFLQRGEVVFACVLALAEAVRCAGLLTVVKGVWRK